MRRRQRIVKRGMDIVGASAALVLFSPLILLGMFAVRISMGSPVFFRQERPGYKGKPFVMVKLRTMRHAVDSSGRLLSDADRMTRTGQLLRSTSIDEQPEFWNVLKGEMSLVGPRPLLMQYLERYTPEQARRHDTRPGITGWAQINGRNDIDWDDRLAMDVWYVDNQSFGLDVKILWRTVLTVFQREGVSAKGHVTMPEFTGSDGGR